MKARKYFKRLSDRSLNPRLVLAAAQRGLAARLDFLVARWLERSAASAAASQRLFEINQKPATEFGRGLTLVVSSPHWDESP
jgi:hypothetical protein